MGTDVRVLVVDDEPDLVDLVQLDLELSGYEVIVATDGVQALERLREERPDVVLLDVMMPRLDGWQVLERMRRDDDLARIPVVMLTALSGEIDRIRGQLSGADRYLTKPFELDELVAAVASVLEATDDGSPRRRPSQVGALLQRLAELEAGRERGAATVRVTRLEGVASARVRPAVDARRLDELTAHQREVASLLASGSGAREIARRLGTSRASVYATRARIARSLGVEPEQVAATARNAGLGAASDDTDGS